MIAPIVWRGFNDEYGSWKIICILVRSGFILLFLYLEISSPSKVIEPDVGSYNFKIVRPTVDFPQPDSPTNPRVSPWLIEKLTPLTALLSPLTREKIPCEESGKNFCKSLTSIIGELMRPPL